jgi:prephenate dehydrogenase
MKKVTVIGLGVMGASIGLAIKKRLIDVRVAGIVRREQHLQQALKMRVADEVYKDFNSEAFKADLVIIAVPILSIIRMIEDIEPFLQKGTIITDIGSIKGLIAEQASRVYGKEHTFIGSHPMCGSEKTGMEHADLRMFDNAPCILTPDVSTDPDDTEKLSSFWKALGCRTLIMDASLHDRQISHISHLPHMLSSVLMNFGCEQRKHYENLLDVAGTGFSDMTRLAEGNPSLWTDILEANRKNIIDSIGSFKEGLEEILNILKKNDKERLFNYLKRNYERKIDFENFRKSHKIKDIS